MTWRHYRGGKGWRIAADRIVCQTLPNPKARLTEVPIGDGFAYRTRGEPESMRQLLRDFGLEIREAADAFDLPIQMITACVGIEAGRLAGDRLRFDPRSVREEPGYRSDQATPHRVSPGLMQTLLSTASQMLDRCPWLEETRGTLTREDLFVPRYSISLGAAYIRHQIERYEDDEEASGIPADDPITNAVAAYNAGSVRYSTESDWHMVAYSPHRIDRYCAWWNDTVELLPC